MKRQLLPPYTICNLPLGYQVQSLIITTLGTTLNRHQTGIDQLYEVYCFHKVNKE
jgi:hypothetical protein